MERESEEASLNDSKESGFNSLKSDNGLNTANPKPTNIAASSITPLTDRSNKLRSVVENNGDATLHLKLKENNQEVSRKGNGMGCSGWKSQICMNGVFCFKVGTRFKKTMSCLYGILQQR